MRVAWVLTLGLVCSCATEKLALAPPPGVNLSGHWVLNEADSDDPLRLAQSQVDPSKAAAGPGGGSGGQGSPSGGRGGRQGRGGAGFGGGAGPTGPAMPGVGALGEGLRWPGREVDVKQIAGVVAISSAGLNEVYEPKSGDGLRRHPGKPSDGDTRDRDMPVRDRDAGRSARCGWDEKTLVVQSRDADDDHPPFEERYSLSEDGQRLIEVVGFKSGRSNGYTVSRVWDRVSPGTATATVAPPGPSAPAVDR